MSTYRTLTLLSIIGLTTVGSAIADVTQIDDTRAAMKIAAITKMYKQDIDDEGMSNPTVLQQYADDDLQAAIQLEQDYFDKHQMSCNVDYDVLWNAQDPDYTQDKKFSVTS
ncbi:hypothetical protein NJD71_09255 [Psychrobacter sp. PP-21]|uniref:hypothetical protein n=1 Tax=Psychrobacter sp. PP-21 TaxID=2957503 RepID=UPI0029AB6119|nr:hypothetical protein [Psychrobacter sp. PP-21]MDX2374314.1 hypothetical protein [Psychrobacter sp. PP-21]